MVFWPSRQRKGNKQNIIDSITIKKVRKRKHSNEKVSRQHKTKQQKLKISAITLNINELNSLIKRQRFSE